MNTILLQFVIKLLEIFEPMKHDKNYYIVIIFIMYCLLVRVQITTEQFWGLRRNARLFVKDRAQGRTETSQAEDHEGPPPRFRFGIRRVGQIQYGAEHQWRNTSGAESK